MKLVDQLNALAIVGYGFQVYGRGECDPDCHTISVTEALNHIEAQDECSVYLWRDGFAQGAVEIVGENGEHTIYDYGSGYENLRFLLDDLTKDD